MLMCSSWREGPRSDSFDPQKGFLGTRIAWMTLCTGVTIGKARTNSKFMSSLILPTYRRHKRAKVIRQRTRQCRLHPSLKQRALWKQDSSGKLESSGRRRSNVNEHHRCYRIKTKITSKQNLLIRIEPSQQQLNREYCSQIASRTALKGEDAATKVMATNKKSKRLSLCA